ncbi:MAG TPA: hypothetical protein VFJ84_02375 [Candidatus Saccharimonadales bacterium]|nr:hypothetical protein [Candidatus Saccharimonadales bacterium]
MPTPRIQYKRTWLGIAGIGTAALLAIAIYGILDQQSNKPTGGGRGSVITQPLVPSDQDSVRSWFGPWHSAPVRSSGAPALVELLPGGGVDVSSWTADTAGWTDADPPQITSVSVTGQTVSLQLGDIAAYRLSVGQPFVIKEVPQQVYAIRRTPKGYSIVSSSAEQVHKLGHHLNQ